MADPLKMFNFFPSIFFCSALLSSTAAWTSFLIQRLSAMELRVQKPLALKRIYVKQRRAPQMRKQFSANGVSNDLPESSAFRCEHRWDTSHDMPIQAMGIYTAHRETRSVPKCWWNGRKDRDFCWYSKYFFFGCYCCCCRCSHFAYMNLFIFFTYFFILFLVRCAYCFILNTWSIRIALLSYSTHTSCSYTFLSIWNRAKIKA